jgi:hypothetical protein
MGFQGHQGGWGSQVFLDIFESIVCFFGPLELVLFFRGLKKGPLTPSHEMNVLKAIMHPVHFYISCRLSGGFIFAIDDTLSGLGSIPVGGPYTRVIFLRARQMCTSQGSTSF